MYTTSKKIFLDAPNVGALEKKQLNKAIDQGFVSTVGPFVQQFEDEMAKYLGAMKAVSVQSGTAAITLALMELGIEPGDEVIVPALTFVGTANPVIFVDAKPVFVDVDLSTWTISLKEIEKKITKKTKAIIPVHLYGNPCRMHELMRLAEKHNLVVIEDATESLGSYYKGQAMGTFGDMGCYSFNGNKMITTGGGGLMVGHETKKLEHLAYLINQAKSEDEDLNHKEVGFNLRMTNIEAALGLAQLQRLEEFCQQKQKFHAIYVEQLKEVDEIKFQEETEGAQSCWWLTCIRITKKINIAEFVALLNSKGVPVRRVFRPIIELEPYLEFDKTECKNSQSIYQQGLCLPSSTLNQPEDVYEVCRIIKELL